MFYLKLIGDNFLKKSLSIEESILFLITSIALVIVLLWYYDRLSKKNAMISNKVLKEEAIYKYKDVLLQENSLDQGNSFPIQDRASLLGKIIIVILILRLLYIPFSYFLGDISFYW